MMTETKKQPIETAPRDRTIMLHDGGYLCGTTGAEVLTDAPARWFQGEWAMDGVYAIGGYQGATWWSEIEPILTGQKETL